MSQMGGWSILDYGAALRGRSDRLPAARLRVVAQLVGAGELRAPRRAATATGFRARTTTAPPAADSCPSRWAARWIGKQMARGAWYYSAEEDVGYCGALRTHATIVDARSDLRRDRVRRPAHARRRGRCSVIPRDGLRVRFHVIRDDAAAAPGARSRRLREGAADRRQRRSVAHPVHAGEPHRRRAPDRPDARRPAGGGVRDQRGREDGGDVARRS